MAKKHSHAPAQELASVQALRALIGELRGGAPPPPSAPSVHEVLAGLGYLSALQTNPQAAKALAGTGEMALESLRAVVQQWLERLPRSPEKNASLAGFYEKTSEHLRRLGKSFQEPPQGQN